jgi:hypothetical protein
MRRCWTAAVAAGCAALCLGCGIKAETSPRALDPGAGPFRAAISEASPAPTGAGRVLVYLARDGVLVAVTRRVPLPATPASVLQALLAGPIQRELDAGLGSAVPARVSVDESTAVPGLVRLQVPPPESSSGARTDEVLGYGQLVLTLTSLPGISSVQFVRDGKALSVPRGDGALSSAALTRRDYAELL